MDKPLTIEEKEELHKKINEILGKNNCEEYFHILVEGSTGFYLGMDLLYEDAQKLREDIWVRAYSIMAILLDLKLSKELRENESYHSQRKKGKNEYKKSLISKKEEEYKNKIILEYKPKILKILLLAMKEFILFRGSNIDENKYRERIKPLVKIIEKEKWNRILNKDKIAKQLNIQAIKCEEYHIPLSPTDNYYITKQKLINLKINKNIINKLLDLTFDKNTYHCSDELKKYQRKMYKIEFKQELEHNSFSETLENMLFIKNRLKSKELVYLPKDAFYMFDAEEEEERLKFSKIYTNTTDDACDEKNDEVWQQDKEEIEKENQKRHKEFY